MDNSLASQIKSVPPIYDEVLGGLQFDDLISRSVALGIELEMRAVLERPNAAELVRSIFGSSPYLTRLILNDPVRLLDLLKTDPEVSLEKLIDALALDVGEAAGRSALMSALRNYKSSIALLLALSDLGGIWPVMKVTLVLSDLADLTLQYAVGYLLAEAEKKGDYFPGDRDGAVLGSGYIVIAMGKHGARELNYSSDIDLIIFYQAGRARLREGLLEQGFFCAPDAGSGQIYVRADRGRLCVSHGSSVAA